MIARIVASIMTGKLLAKKKKMAPLVSERKRSPKRDKSPKSDTFKKGVKNKHQSRVEAAPDRIFPEVLADIQKGNLDL